MTVIDTHSHIYLPEFQQDRALVLERAEKEGVKVVLMPAIDSGSHAAMIELEKSNPGGYYSMMGLHPSSVKENYQDELNICLKWLDSHPFKGIGEIGLDFYWDLSYTDQQYKAFHQQLEWSIDKNLPVSIHSRNATAKCIEAVDQYKGKIKGVFHCFSGDRDQADQIIELGMFMGIGGVVTFKNGGLDKILVPSDLNHLVLETDAPYLAPVPFRGKRNEPAYLKYVVQKLSEIMKVDKAEIAETTTKNAKKIFYIL